MGYCLIHTAVDACQILSFETVPFLVHRGEDYLHVWFYCIYENALFKKSFSSSEEEYKELKEYKTET